MIIIDLVYNLTRLLEEETMQKFWIYVARKLHAAAIADLEREDRAKNFQASVDAQLKEARELLARLEGHSKVDATTGREVLIRLRTGDYDLLFQSVGDVQSLIENAVVKTLDELRPALRKEVEKYARSETR